MQLTPFRLALAKDAEEFLEFGFSVVNFGRAAAVLGNLALSIICMDLIQVGWVLHIFL